MPRSSTWPRFPFWWMAIRSAFLPACGRRRNSRGRFPDNVLYIYEKQLEEADLIVLNKADRLSGGELAELRASLAARFPGQANPGDVGTDRRGCRCLARMPLPGRVWPVRTPLTLIMIPTPRAKPRWVGSMPMVALRGGGPIDWQAFATDLLEEIRRQSAAAGAEIAHVKLIIGRGGRKPDRQCHKQRRPRFHQWPSRSRDEPIDDADQRPRTYRAGRTAGDRGSAPCKSLPVNGWTRR